MILGRMLERSVQQSLTMSGGDLAIFIQKPISAGLLGVAAFVLISPGVRWLLRKRRPCTSEAPH
jgi:putative tricarboxylic transport membrane protein